MFGSRANGNYRPVNLGEFSDDSSDEGDDFIQRSVKAQQVCGGGRSRVVCNDTSAP